MKADAVNATPLEDMVSSPYSVPQMPTKAGAICKLSTRLQSGSTVGIYLDLSWLAFWFGYLLNPNILLSVIPGRSHFCGQNGSTIILAGTDTKQLRGQL